MTGLQIKEGDKLFFSSSCTVVPDANAANQTVPLTITNLNEDTGEAQMALPSASGTPLLSDGAVPRTLYACYATQESLLGTTTSSVAYVPLADTLTVVPTPRLGISGAPSDIRSLNGSSPDYQISQAAVGDLIFFRSGDCSVIPSNSSTTTKPSPMILYNSTGSGLFKLSALTSDGQSTRVLKACFAPSGCKETVAANYVELVDKLNVIPEPIGATVTSWVESEITELSFASPKDHAGQPGDLVVLKQDNCSDVHTITRDSPSVGLVYSSQVAVEEGNIIRNFRLAENKLKELPAGKYKLCYATKSSEGWSADDWKTLALDVTITGTSTEAPPSLTVPQAVALGADITVIWNASTPLQERVSQPGAWLGIFPKGACGDDVGEGRHECYLGHRMLPVGESTGVVRFTQQEYRTAGEYDVRFMRGDLTNAQGRACKGLTQSRSGTFLYCMYTASTISSTVTVVGRVENFDDLASVPGLEHVVQV
jgi:hypothetical protein